MHEDTDETGPNSAIFAFVTMLQHRDKVNQNFAGQIA
jgi:hypothetical protein